MDKKLILYSFRRCPYAMRARIALDLVGVVCEHREVSLKNKPQSLLDYSPKGQVPVMVLPDGKVLEESLDIILWAFEQKEKKESFLQTKESKKWALEQITLNDTEFKKNLDICKYSVKYSAEELAKAKKNCYKILSEWDLFLRKTSYFNGEAFGLLDLALLPFIRQFSRIKPDLFSELKAPSLKKWLDKETQTELFERVMKKHDLWDEKKEHLSH